MEAPPIRPVRIPPTDEIHLKRIRAFSHFLDQSIKLPFGVRIGVDPLVGLVPGIGDAISTVFSFVLIFEAARLGIPKRALGVMIFNVALEALAGTIPLLGDVFDAVWKANMRNARLVEAVYRPDMPRRSKAQIFASLGAFCIGLIVLMVILGALILKGIFALFD
ncbi:MAG TPA: DUF4112 domain-containing protein [Methylomirabilota bacterium]|nr:DUF4112 domain-containing protein [Methylomirabilota bacterium]